MPRPEYEGFPYFGRKTLSWISSFQFILFPSLFVFVKMKNFGYGAEMQRDHVSYDKWERQEFLEAAEGNFEFLAGWNIFV